MRSPSQIQGTPILFFLEKSVPLSLGFHFLTEYFSQKPSVLVAILGTLSPTKFSATLLNKYS